MDVLIEFLCIFSHNIGYRLLMVFLVVGCIVFVFICYLFSFFGLSSHGWRIRGKLRDSIC